MNTAEYLLAAPHAINALCAPPREGGQQIFGLYWCAMKVMPP